MSESIMELLLHPQRMRLVQAFLFNPKLNVLQIRELLPDIPPATLYRNLHKLHQGGILEVVAENAIRGTVEKVYALTASLNEQTAQFLENAQPEEHFRYFFTFLMHILGDFEQYQRRETKDLAQDGLGYRQASLYVSDAEWAELVTTLGSAINRAAANPPAPGRRRLSLSTICIPTGQGGQ